MTGMQTLEVIICLVVIFAVYSVLTTTIVGILISLTRFRALSLTHGISRLLECESEGMTKLFYDHPMIKSISRPRILRKTKLRKPSYIKANMFARVVLQIIAKEGGDDSQNENDIKAALLKLDPKSSGVLHSLFIEANEDVDAFKLLVEQWYNDSMDRVSGWFKHNAQLVSFLVGLTVAIVMNLNTIAMTKSLATDPAIRAQFIENVTGLLANQNGLLEQTGPSVVQTAAPIVVADTSNVVSDSSASIAGAPAVVTSTSNVQEQENLKQLSNLTQKYKAIMRDSDMVQSALNLPPPTYGFKDWLGYLITAIALSLGAPFWFSVLTKLMQFRGSISPKENEGKPNVPA
ncbi:MAG: hypothetical protein JKY54_07735 [Flavobacteriales bacterium]|nr:hypothetical protein [Flavobacteriales bacterium]